MYLGRKIALIIIIAITRFMMCDSQNMNYDIIKYITLQCAVLYATCLLSRRFYEI